MALFHCPGCRNVNIRIVFIHHVTHLEFLNGITINAHLQHNLPSFSFLQTSCTPLCPAFPWPINGFTKVKYFMDRWNLSFLSCPQQTNILIFTIIAWHRQTNRFYLWSVQPVRDNQPQETPSNSVTLPLLSKKRLRQGLGQFRHQLNLNLLLPFLLHLSHGCFIHVF